MFFKISQKIFKRKHYKLIVHWKPLKPILSERVGVFHYVIDVLEKAKIILLLGFYITPSCTFDALYERTEVDGSVSLTIPHPPPPGNA